MVMVVMSMIVLQDEHWAVLMVVKMVVVVMSMVVLQDEQSLLWRRWWWWWRSWWFCKMSSLDCGEGATAGEQMHLLQLSYWAQEVWQRMQVENHVSNHHQQPNFSNHHHQQPSNRLSGSNFVLPFDHLSGNRMLPQGSVEYHERWRQSWYLPGLSGNFMYYPLFFAN